MKSRSAPVSNEDNRPETSTSEIIPAWRIRIEKFAVVTVLALSAGGDHSTCGTRKRAEKLRGRERCGKVRWFGNADCRAANFYWRITMWSPRRQLSARPTRTISSSDERYFRSSSVVG